MRSALPLPHIVGRTAARHEDHGDGTACSRTYERPKGPSVRYTSDDLRSLPPDVCTHARGTMADEVC